MPLSTDSKTNEVAKATVDQFHTVFGPHPGFRPAHARGILVNGIFSPSEAAKSLSTAPHFNQPSTPITARFSSSTGLPELPNSDPNAAPFGFAVRFNLGERKHTDIVAHSTPFFPVNNGADFLAFLQAIAGGTVPDFLASHPAALTFVQAPKPTPKSLANEAFFGVTSLKFINAEGRQRFFRYRIVPEAGLDHFTAEDDLKDKSPSFLFDEIPELLKSGPVTYKLLAQLAEEGDVTGDATIHWPEERTLAELGTIKLESFVEDSADQQRTIIYDPVPRIQGLDVSDDPLVDFRAAVYLISGRERRAAGGYHH